MHSFVHHLALMHLKQWFFLYTMISQLLNRYFLLNEHRDLSFLFHYFILPIIIGNGNWTILLLSYQCQKCLQKLDRKMSHQHTDELTHHSQA